MTNKITGASESSSSSSSSRSSSSSFSSMSLPSGLSLSSLSLSSSSLPSSWLPRPLVPPPLMVSQFGVRRLNALQRGYPQGYTAICCFLFFNFLLFLALFLTFIWASISEDCLQSQSEMNGSERTTGLTNGENCWIKLALFTVITVVGLFSLFFENLTESNSRRDACLFFSFMFFIMCGFVFLHFLPGENYPGYCFLGVALLCFVHLGVLLMVRILNNIAPGEPTVLVEVRPDILTEEEVEVLNIE